MIDITGIKNPNYKTGLKIKGSKETGIYNSWMNMKQRCDNKKNPKYVRYGGRGIKVCQEWYDIHNFYEWAKKSGWFEGASIDRINNDGNYCPENCRWISMSENSRKKRTTKISFEQAKIIRERLDNGENENQLAKEYGVVHGTIWFIKNRFTHVDENKCSEKLKSRKKNDKIPSPSQLRTMPKNRTGRNRNPHIREQRTSRKVSPKRPEKPRCRNCKKALRLIFRFSVL